MKCACHLAIWAAATVLLAAAAPTGADVLKVDLDANSATQSGFQGFTLGGGAVPAGSNAGVPGGTNMVFASSLGVGGNVTVTLGSGLVYNRTPAVTGTGLDDLGTDWLLDTTVTLGTLNAGVYRVTMYNHDAGYNQQTANLAITDVVTPGGGTRDVIWNSTGATPAGGIRTNTFLLRADGTNPVSFQTHILNGFDLANYTLPTHELKANVAGGGMVEDTDYQNVRRLGTAIPLLTDFGTGLGGSVSATVSNPNGSLQTRERTGPASPIMLRTFVFNTGGQIDLTLSNLPAGDYEILTYHLDSTGGVSDQFTVAVDTGSGFGAPSAQFTQAGEGTSGHLETFTADGTNDVVLRVTGIGSNRAVLNGFDLTYVPEPATLALLALGVLPLVTRRRRRK